MTSRILISLFVLLATASFPVSGPGKNSAASASTAQPQQAQQAQIERGRYLVEEVARCWECHSPRLRNGDPDHSHWLQGAPIWIMPVQADPNWAMRAPSIAGFPSFTEAQGERILEQGIGPNGLPIREPMHTYHLKHEDAVAIIAYLKTLPPGVSPQ